VIPRGPAAAEGTSNDSWEEVWLGAAADAFVDAGDHPVRSANAFRGTLFHC
jgi:hypothetical protein